MNRLPIVSLAIALVTTSAAAADKPMAMPAMAMKMIDPMPAVYMGEADKPGAPLFKGLGTHHHKITTKNKRTQLLFDQGIRLDFGFNHAEAIRSFREAARLDPHCAMCWWGVAFSLGSNINLPMQDDAIKPAWQALQNAVALKRYASKAERDWIDALAVRYSSDPKPDRAKLDAAYADAMGALWKKYPNDLDAGTFYAEAMMDTQPWDYWQSDGVTPKGHAVEIVATLEDIIKRSPNHPGALHLYIHAVEATTTPERAEAPADRLEVLMPGAGHIVHMPSHIYYRVGRYSDSLAANKAASKVDESYFTETGAIGVYPIGYYSHNLHFVLVSAQLLGDTETVLAQADKLDKWLTNEVAAAVPIAQPIKAAPYFAWAQYGEPDKILAMPEPKEAPPFVNAMWHYARGIARAKMKDTAAARNEAEVIERIRRD